MVRHVQRHMTLRYVCFPLPQAGVVASENGPNCNDNSPAIWRQGPSPVGLGPGFGGLWVRDHVWLPLFIQIPNFVSGKSFLAISPHR